MRCANCGGKDHLKDACTKAKVPIGSRPCYECGRPGHTAAQCRSKGRTNLIEDQLNLRPTSEDSLGMVGDRGDILCVGFKEVQRRDTKSRPMPSTPTLNAFMPTMISNKFEAFQSDDDDDDDDEHAHGQHCDCLSVRQRRRLAAREAKASRRTMDCPPALDWSTQQDVLPKASVRFAADTEMVTLKKEPNTNDNEPNDNLAIIGVVYEKEFTEVNDVEEEVEVEVAADSGCVCHICGPDDVPTTVEVAHKQGKRRRNLVNASGGDMDNFGEADVDLVQQDGATFSSTFTVTNATRPLHSTSQICDNKSPACPDGHEMLYTQGVATVVPAGSLSKYLDKVRQIARYPRRGGLYVAKMKVRARGRRPSPKPKPERAPAQGFGRQGAKR